MYHSCQQIKRLQPKVALFVPAADIDQSLRLGTAIYHDLMLPAIFVGWTDEFTLLTKTICETRQSVKSSLLLQTEDRLK